MLESRYVVFYDVEDRRAWLINGTSALLHLVRASIRHYQNNPRLRHIFEFKAEAFREAVNPYTGLDAAFEVLSNFDNLELPLYRKPRETTEKTTRKLGGRPELASESTTSYVTLKDRIEDIFSTLSQIMAHQDDVHTQTGVGFRLRSTPRKQLEGFDFMDIAAKKGTLWPKTATLQAMGRGWVDLTRSLHAIHLFGKGFGELLQPAGTEGPCKSCYWNSSLPTGKDYLAISTKDLQPILSRQGSVSSRPWRLNNNIYWHAPDEAFKPCKCSSMMPHQYCRIQVLLPPTFHRPFGRAAEFKSPTQLPTHGAVIFGHNWKFPLRWSAQGDPKVGEPEQDADEDEDEDDSDDEVLRQGSASGAIWNNDGSSREESATSSSLYSQNNLQFIDEHGAVAPIDFNRYL